MRYRGFTLIELLVTIAVAIILATTVVPAFQRMMAVNRVAVDYNELLSGLNYARSEAVKRRVEVTFDVTSIKPWAYRVMVEGDSEPIRVRSGRDDRTELDNQVDVAFNSLGRPVGTCISGCSFTMKSSLYGDSGRAITISSMGRVGRGT